MYPVVMLSDAWGELDRILGLPAPPVVPGQLEFEMEPRGDGSMGVNYEVTTREYVLGRLEQIELRACLYSDMTVGLSEEEERALKVTLFDLIADDLVYLRTDRHGKKWVLSAY